MGMFYCIISIDVTFINFQLGTITISLYIKNANNVDIDIKYQTMAVTFSNDNDK